MAIFRKYLYCKNCERPHREWETRYYTVQAGSDSCHNVHHCIGCDEILERPEPAFLQFVILGLFLVMAFLTFSSVQKGMWGGTFWTVVLGGGLYLQFGESQKQTPIQARLRPLGA